MDNLRIVCDIDGVLANTHLRAVEYINENLWDGFPLTIEDCTEWDVTWTKQDGSKIHIWDGIYPVLTDEESLMEIPTIWGAVGGANYLNRIADEFIIATHRGQMPSRWSTNWLKKHGIPFDASISILGSKHILNPDVIIEDDPRDWGNLREGTLGILLNRPWNAKAEIPNGVVRAKDWFEVIELVVTRHD